MGKLTNADQERKGVPLGLLNVKGALSPEGKDEIRREFEREFGGPDGAYRIFELRPWRMSRLSRFLWRLARWAS